ncbi:hypothetical protein [Actinophytocola sp.]|uniref:hypothetical protein n=1 Tax=Actinophytocola sp. TaxID=1872138 RepID=UPI002ED079BA
MTSRVVAVAACLAALGLAGCTTPEAPPPTTQSTENQPVARPKDRDKDAVLAAVRQLDLCALLDKAKTVGPFAGARPVARQPFECTLTGAAGLVTVTAIGIGHQNRIESAIRTIGGAKAYVKEGGGCYVSLPVSFTTALEFSQAPAPGCADVTTLAAAAADALADPDSLQTKPVWDACTALADALDADETKLSGNGLADCTSAPATASISFVDDLPPSDEQQPTQTTIGGTQVRVYDEEDCVVSWRQEPFDVRYASTPDYPVVVRTPDCDTSKDLAESLMAVLEKAPPSDVAPQRPLLYRPDELDSPYPGACAYVDELDPNRCEPYVEVMVPDDPAEILRAANDDADVQCAMAVRSVGTRFGSKLVPVADSEAGTRCFFVEPERRLQLTFSLSHGKVVNDFDGKPVTIAGHPGFVTTDKASITYELSTATKLDGEGTVALSVSAGPATAEVLAPGTDENAESVLTDVLREYFS